MPSTIADSERGSRSRFDPGSTDSVNEAIEAFSYFGGQTHHSELMAYLRDTAATGNYGSWPMVYKSFVFGDGFVSACVFHRPFLDAMPMTFAAPPHALAPKAYSIEESPLGGVGVFATRDIPTGVPIIVEHPCTLVPVLGESTYKIGDDVITSNDKGDGDTIRYLLSNVPVEQADQFLKLSNCHPAECYDHEAGISRTNVMAVDLPMKTREGEPKPFDKHAAVFLKMSRCNHSCGPNASYLWNATSFTMTLHSTRRIPAGTEITIAYVGLQQSRTERQDALKKMYRFDCKCSQCTLPSAKAVAQSDARRREIDAFDFFKLPSFQQWVENPTFPAAMMMAPFERFMKITEKEGMHYSDARYACAMVLSNMAAAMEDEGRFRHWTKALMSAFLTVECKVDLMEGIARSERTETNAKTVIQWMANPRECMYWGMRRMLTGQAFM